MQSEIPQRHSSVAGQQDGSHLRDLAINLEPEFYTCAFVSPLHIGEKSGRGYGKCFFTLAMLFVGSMQCITVFGMAAYLVEKERGYSDEFRLSTLLFTEGGATMGAGTAQDLCGQFNDVALDQISGTGHMQMTDGTAFEGSKGMSTFHSFKMPSGSWNFNTIGGHDSYVDKLLRVLHDNDWRPNRWRESIEDCRVMYGVLFVIMVAVLYYHVLHETRKVGHFILVLRELHGRGLETGHKGTTHWDPVEGVIVIDKLNSDALFVGCLCVAMRLAVALMMLVWGTVLLASSGNKLSLVLNSLAIGIVFELDGIIAYAVVDHNTMTRVEEIQPVKVSIPNWIPAKDKIYDDGHIKVSGMDFWDVAFSAFLMLFVVGAACCARAWQVNVHGELLHLNAALCLFAGPTPQARQDVLSPVPGFCESLLSLTCAPNVTGSGRDHGPCLVTDQNIFQDRSVMLYADGKLFDNMYDASGKRRSMKDWGDPQSKLTNEKTWANDKYLNLFRRVCTQMYQPADTVDKRTIDAESGMTMYSAPFYCPREKLFQAVFGEAVSNFDKWTSNFDLQGGDVVKALDGCRSPPRVSPDSPVSVGGDSSAVAEASADVADVGAHADVSAHALPINALVAAYEPLGKAYEPAKLVRLGHHRVHREVSHEPEKMGHLRHHRTHREVDQKWIRAST